MLKFVIRHTSRYHLPHFPPGHHQITRIPNSQDTPQDIPHWIIARAFASFVVAAAPGLAISPGPLPTILRTRPHRQCSFECSQTTGQYKLSLPTPTRDPPRVLNTLGNRPSHGSGCVYQELGPPRIRFDMSLIVAWIAQFSSTDRALWVSRVDRG